MSRRRWADIPRLIPSPLDQATSEKAAAGGGQPGPFSTAKLDADSGPPGRYSEAQLKEPRAMAFDGLAMGAVTEKDVFSEFPTPEAKASDAEFGGVPVEEGPAPTPVGGDAVFTQSPKAPGGPAVNLEKDFAEDEFWNRTDEQDDVRKGREWDPDEAVAAHHENVSREAEEPLAEEEQTEEILAETPEEPAAGEIAEEAIGEAIADEALGIEPEQGRLRWSMRRRMQMSIWGRRWNCRRWRMRSCFRRSWRKSWGLERRRKAIWGKRRD